ncbi:MAG: single-stranded-DNA-specific exonuclease RecJ [Lachnospiraceae bacterium]|nr:single-stranded-DNA-specific exonuclease RecJ [Lachnospiraceae bacterium]
MAKWFISAKKADFDDIGRKFNISPILARLIRNRDIIDEEDIRKYLHGTIEEMYDPFLLKGMADAVIILADKIQKSAPMRIIGDYDVDGICSAFILLKGLNSLGGKADTVLPHRIKDGYGLNENLIIEAHEAGIDTIITCDNGIAATRPVKLAKEMNMTVIVTDHHEVPYEEECTLPGQENQRFYQLPPADAIVDPWQPDCPYPFKQICGGMAALKVIEALYIQLSLSIPDKLHEELRCLAAAATICDVMELSDENRILTKYGLKHLRECENLGIRALIEVNGIDAAKLSPYHIGFIIGPCLNATGRLDTAERAIALLKATDYREAIDIAGGLKSLNENRKEMTAKGVEAAIAIVEELFHDKDKEMFHAVLVLYLPDCHESLAGIIAGRIKERYHRPVFVLTDGDDGVKGSGRSIETYHMYDEMCKCKDLFTKFGGHKQAAGFSMPPENIEKLRQALNENAALTEGDFIPKISIDIAMPLSYISPQLIREFDLLEPFGIANPKPVFAQKDLILLNGRVMGKTGRAAKYKVSDCDGRKFEILHFGDIDAFDKFLSDKFSPAQKELLYKGSCGTEPMKINITYYPDMVTYKGKEDIRIVMQNYC